MKNRAIFVGLGGAGVSAVGHLKAKLLSSAKDLNDLKNHCRFIFIDTADDRIKEINGEYANQFEDALISSSEMIVGMPGTNPNAHYRAAQLALRNDQATAEQTRLLSFVDSEGTSSWSNESLENGASGNRQLGRVGVWNSINDIESKVTEALNALNSITKGGLDSKSLPIYLFSGSCGGTGSSAFLDVAFILDQTFKKVTTRGESQIISFIFMPRWYISHYDKTVGHRVAENYRSNSYAFFEEIKYFLKDRYKKGDPRGADFAKISVKVTPGGVDDRVAAGVSDSWRLFTFAVCIDNMAENGKTFTLPQMYRNAAEMVYYWYQGNTANSVLAKLDNTLTEIYSSTSPEHSIPAFATMGYRALQFPDVLMNDYFESRFLYEVLNYGIVGDEYEHALTEAVRKKELSDIFDECIARFLFADRLADKQLPNLENHRSKVVEEYLLGLTDSNFKSEANFGSRLLRREDSTQDYDVEKIGNQIEISNLIASVESLSENILRNLKAAFEGREALFQQGDVQETREKLLKQIRFGNTDGETEKGNGNSLENILENSILRFGFRYAIGLDREIEKQVERVAGELRTSRETSFAKIREVEREVEEAKHKCISGNSRDQKKAFPILFSRLQDLVRLRSRIEIIDQQIRILLDLSEGEIGILDIYRQHLEKLLVAIEAKIAGEGIGEDREIGLKDGYLLALPRRFSATAEDVTTTFIPEVKGFASQVGWTSGHLFSLLYSKVIPQVKGTNGESPLRHAKDLGKSLSGSEGLHRILYEMLTQESTTGVERGWDKDGQLRFFRTYFRDGLNENLMINRLFEYSRKYIEGKIESSDDIKRERDMPLGQRLEGLSSSERRSLKELFSDAGTQVFCNMSGASNQRYTSLYVSPNQELAETLGYSSTDPRSAFLETRDTNRFVKLKLVETQVVDNYASYGDYKMTYFSTKAEREKDGTVFAPHIHRLFNTHGVEGGIRLVYDRQAVSPMITFAQTIFYWKLFEKVAAADKNLFRMAIHIEDHTYDDRETLISPIVVQNLSDNKKAVSAPHTVEVETITGRIIFRRKNFVNLGEASSYPRIFSAVQQRDDVLGALVTVDKLFRGLCNSGWAKYIDETFDESVKTIKGKMENVGGDFYKTLGTDMKKVHDDLFNHCSSRNPSNAVDTNEDADADF